MTVRVFAKCPSLISSIINIDYDSSIIADRGNELLAQIVTEDREKKFNAVFAHEEEKIDCDEFVYLRRSKEAR